MKNIQTFEKYFGGNSGYIGYSMSKRAKDARNDGKYPKTDFKKEYNITENSLKSLIDTDYINNNEWHHTSKYGNKTIFYSWAEEYYYDIYINNKKQIDKISSNKDLTRQETIDKIKYFFENSEIYKNEEIKKDKQSEIDKYNRHIWSEYQTKKLNLDKKISSIDSKINKQFEENLPQNKLSRSHSGALFYNHYENGENSGVNIVPNVLNNITWRERILNNFNIYKHIDIKTKTKVAYIQDADIAFNKIDKKLFMEKQKLEKQKEEEQLLYKKNLENFRKNENIEIDNFTARYYDNYDDEEDENTYDDNSIEALRKIQMFEKDKKQNKYMYIKSYYSFLNEKILDYINIYQSFRYLDFEILENGNLKIILNDEGKKEVDDNGISENNFYDYFDDIQGNSEFRYYNNVSDLGMMSEAPAIIYGVNFNDNGDYILTKDSIIWIYNDYVIKDFTEDLVEQGYVIFNNSKPFTKSEIEKFKKEKYKLNLNNKTKKYNI